ncbi:hypothetical protein OIDMADRAFT_56655 [Oidiodendron maius Zn]|uniref:Uncharacterized protein n=1 Tax=Oidiodendron maius (strain Zn) TaxID=913774 RepID=A0A0C3D8N0_OIDMZ|nr:hypothetical protein OIDMADRAFT_56655 [Oidiodendron maius Zn]
MSYSSVGLFLPEGFFVEERRHQAYYDISQQLGIHGWEESKLDIKKLVKDYLSKESKESAGQWVLVFDNADNIDMWMQSHKNGHPPLIECLPRCTVIEVYYLYNSRQEDGKLACS